MLFLKLVRIIRAQEKNTRAHNKSQSATITQNQEASSLSLQIQPTKTTQRQHPIPLFPEHTKIRSQTIINKHKKKFNTKNTRFTLWYLSEEVAHFALFLGSVSTKEKKKIASTILKKINNENMETGVPVMPQMNQNVKVSSLIGKNSRLLFDLLKVHTKWLSLIPDEWSKNYEFNYIFGILKDLKVVNNLAERSVKLVTDFNQSLTRNENQKQ